MMDAILTNRGKFLFLEWSLFQDNLPSTFYYILLQQGHSVSIDNNTVSDVWEIVEGNGYTSGGVLVPLTITEGASITEDDINDLASVVLRNLTAVAASGGAVPVSQGNVRYGALTTDEGTIADRQIIAIFDLDPIGETGWSIPDAKQLDIQGHQIKLVTPA